MIQSTYRYNMTFNLTNEYDLACYGTTQTGFW